MTETLMRDQAIEEVEPIENGKIIATLWLLFLGMVLGATLICSVVLMAWPIVAQFAAKLY